AIFKRKDEGEEARVPSTGTTASETTTPTRSYNRSPGSVPGSEVATPVKGGNGNERRHVPGAALSAPGSNNNENDGKKTRKRNKGKKDGEKNGKGNKQDAEDEPEPEPIQVNDEVANLTADPSSPVAPDGALDPVAKKIRNLNK